MNSIAMCCGEEEQASWAKLCTAATELVKPRITRIDRESFTASVETSLSCAHEAGIAELRCGEHSPKKAIVIHMRFDMSYGVRMCNSSHLCASRCKGAFLTLICADPYHTRQPCLAACGRFQQPSASSQVQASLSEYILHPLKTEMAQDAVGPPCSRTWVCRGCALS